VIVPPPALSGPTLRMVRPVPTSLASSEAAEKVIGAPAVVPIESATARGQASDSAESIA